VKEWSNREETYEASGLGNYQGFIQIKQCLRITKWENGLETLAWRASFSWSTIWSWYVSVVRGHFAWRWAIDLDWKAWRYGKGAWRTWQVERGKEVRCRSLQLEFLDRNTFGWIRNLIQRLLLQLFKKCLMMRFFEPYSSLLRSQLMGIFLFRWTRFLASSAFIHAKSGFSKIAVRRPDLGPIEAVFHLISGSVYSYFLPAVVVISMQCKSGSRTLWEYEAKLNEVEPPVLFGEESSGWFF